uniref:(northern house mosquito) hypothetical protein n=1 Tax=Culex pipiens TaxID=7175 RepID=A0A8D8B2Q2_CULPI
MCSCLARQAVRNERMREDEGWRGGEMSNLNAKVKQKQTNEICHTCVSASQFRVSDLNLFFFFKHKLSFLQNAAACSFFIWENGRMERENGGLLSFFLIATLVRLRQTRAKV